MKKPSLDLNKLKSLRKPGERRVAESEARANADIDGRTLRKRKLARDKQIIVRATPEEKALLVELSEAFQMSFTDTVHEALRLLRDRKMGTK